MSVSNKSAAGDFDELLKSLNDVSDDTEKLAVKDDEAIAAAAAEAKAGGADVDGDDEEDDEEEDETGEGKEFGKSLGLDGSGAEMIDATDLVKSLISRLDTSDGVMAKALTAMAGVASKQNDLIKSLQADVKAMSVMGRGRKTLLTMTDKPDVADALTKSEKGSTEEAGGITPTDLLAKCDAAFTAGKLSANEFNTVDVCLRNSWPIDAGILRRVAAASV